MQTFYAVLLGLLQGMTEFLPISSSGHLLILKYILDMPEIPIVYDVLLHGSTLLVIITVTRKTLANCFITLFSSNPDPQKTIERNLAHTILFGLIPTALIGYAIDSQLLPLPTIGVGIAFLVTALMLFLTKFFTEKRTLVTPLHAILIGIIHGFTVLPGISRTGLIIVSVLFLGYSKKTALSVALVSAIPIILGALLLKIRDIQSLEGVFSPMQILLGCLVAFFSGMLSYSFLKNILNQQKLSLFSIYLVFLGSGILMYSLV